MVLLFRPLAGGAKEVFAFACLVAGDFGPVQRWLCRGMEAIVCSFSVVRGLVLCAFFTPAHCPVLDPGIRTVAQSRKWCFLAHYLLPCCISCTLPQRSKCLCNFVFGCQCCGKGWAPFGGYLIRATLCDWRECKVASTPSA